jgi:hypothetical protein
MAMRVISARVAVQVPPWRCDCGSSAALLMVDTLRSVVGKIEVTGQLRRLGVVLVGLSGMAAVSIFVPFEGRTPAEWIPVALRFGLRHRRGGYRSNAPGVGFRLVGQEDREVSLPPELEGVELLSFPIRG